jgi:hypothetical protein
MALGHARVVNRMEGDRPTVNREVMEAFAQLSESNFSDFIRYGLTQVTHGSIGDELATRMLERSTSTQGQRSSAPVNQPDAGAQRRDPRRRSPK